MLNNKKTFLFFTILITALFAMTIVSATDNNDMTSDTDMPAIDESLSASDNVNMISEKQEVNKEDNNNKLNTVSTTDTPTRHDTKNIKTKTETVTNYSQLVSKIEDAKTSNDDSYTINLQPGNYTATTYITWGNAIGTTRKLVINGNGLTLDGNFKNQFMRINEGYTLELNNITLTNYGTIENIDSGAIYNNGNVTLTNSNITSSGSFKNGGAIYNAAKANLTINNSNLIHTDATLGGGIYNKGNATITNSTLSICTADKRGGAIYNDDDAILNITNTNFTANSASDIDGEINGGAIYNKNGTINITNSTFTKNRAHYINGVSYGGTIYNKDGTIIITGCEFNNNNASEGGAIYNDNGEITIHNSNFTNNNATSHGGAIKNNGTLSIVSSNFDNNYAENGGSIYNQLNLNISNSNFTNNNATSHGGAIYNNYETTITYSNFAYNAAENIGGAIYNNNILKVNNSNFTYNTAANQGGAIFNNNVSTSVTDSYFMGNTPENFMIKNHKIVLVNTDEYVSNIDSVSIYLDDDDTCIYTGELNGYTVPLDHSIRLMVNGRFARYDKNLYLLEAIPSKINITGYASLVETIETIKEEGYDDLCISLQPGDYNATSNILWGNADWDVRKIIIDGNGLTLDGNNQYQFMNITEGYILELKNITLTNYYSSNDGTIHNEGNLSITDVNFINNTADGHAGAVNNKGTLNISNSTFTGNRANSGGALYSHKMMSISNSNFTHNNANSGGGVIYTNDNATTSITDSNFISNIAGYHGGVIANMNNASTVITSCNFTNTTSGGEGASIYNRYGNMTVTTSQFINNTGNANGGTITNDRGIVKLNNSYIEGNTPVNFIIKNRKISLNNSDNYISVANVSIYLDDDDTCVYTGALDDYIVPKGHRIRLCVDGSNPDEFSNNTFILEPVFLDSSPSNYDELVAAVEVAKRSDDEVFNISLLPGNYNATANITWNDATGSTRKIIIDGNGLTLDGRNRFQFMKVGAGYTLELNNITFTQYKGINGSVINNNGNVHITNANFTRNNIATYGTIFSTNTVDISQSIFYKNNADVGGAIYIADGNLSITDSSFTNNSAQIAGAIWVENGNININTSEFTNNTATMDAGAVLSKGNMTISKSKFTHNIATLNGGAISNPGYLNITSSEFISNRANNSGAIYNYGTLDLTKSKFNDNHATSLGGAIRIVSNVKISHPSIFPPTDEYEIFIDNTTITDCTFNQNKADNGGAIYVEPNLIIIQYSLSNPSTDIPDYDKNRTKIINSNFTENTANKGGAIYSQNENISLYKVNFTNNQASNGQGGAIYSNNANINISESTFDKNHATSTGSIVGGAIFFDGTDNILNITDSNFTNNQGEYGDGGAIYATGAEVIVNKTNFIENLVLGSGNRGGAIRITNGSLTVSTSKFINNTAIATGGAINAEASINVTDSIFTGNNAGRYGGAIFSSGNNLTISSISNSNFTNNTVKINGGAIFNTINLSITDSNFINNTADNKGGTQIDNFGGAILNNGRWAILNITGCNLTKNSALTSGGAIYNNGTINVNDNLFTYNTAPNGGAMYNELNTTVTDSTFKFNNATNGSAIYNNATSYINTSNFTNNTAEISGAIYNNDSTIYVNGSTFYNNNATNGSAIYNEHGYYNITNSNFTHNIANYGGAIYAHQHQNSNNITCTYFINNIASHDGGAFYASYQICNINDSYFINNSASEKGGAIYCLSIDNINITSSNFTNNHAIDGGAIYNSRSWGTIGIIAINTNFTINQASNSGGAIYDEEGADFYLDASYLTNNSANYGGAITNYGYMHMNDSKLIDNYAKQYGGAIYIIGYGEVIKSHFDSNEALVTGGAIYLNRSDDYWYFQIEDSNFTNNTANFNGGAIFKEQGQINVTTSNFRGNKQDNFIIENREIKFIRNDGFISVNTTSIYIDGNDTLAYSGELSNYVVPQNSTLRLVVNGTDSSIFKDNVFILEPINDEIIVNGYPALVRAVEIAKQSCGDFYINLTPGDYNATANIEWGDCFGDTRKLIIEGNGLILDGNFEHQFMSIKEGYTLELNNITLTNYGTISTIDGGAINNNGNLTITNSNITSSGSFKNGGAIYNAANANLTINNSNLIHSDATIGGGIYNKGNATITNSTLSLCSANKRGGAIYNDEAAILNITNTNFTTHLVLDLEGEINGGAIYNNNGTISITDSSFTKNKAVHKRGVSHGGAIYNKDGTIIITGCEFNNNNASEGGAIYNDNGEITLYNSNFTNNNATSHGGAIKNNGTLSIVSSNFDNNTAEYGGSIYNQLNLNISNSNFTNNNATIGGGAICNNENAIMTIDNSYFANNNASEGGAINNEGTLRVITSNFDNNYAEDGGSIYNQLNLNISNSNFTKNNAAMDGGAIHSIDGNLIIITSNFKDNLAKFSGGAIYLNGEGNISNSNFTNNTSRSVYGGSAITNKGNLFLTGLNVTNNHADSNGAIYNTGTLNVTLSNFKNNTAYSNGGAIYTYYGHVYITASNFTNNSGTLYGGAVYNNHGAIDINASNFNSNTAGRYGGGAISNHNDGNLSVTQSNFTNNTARRNGSAIYNEANINISNCIFKYNVGNISNGAINTPSEGNIIIENNVFISNIPENFIKTEDNTLSLVCDDNYIPKSGPVNICVEDSTVNKSMSDNIVEDYVLPIGSYDMSIIVNPYGTSPIRNNTYVMSVENTDLSISANNASCKYLDTIPVTVNASTNITNATVSVSIGSKVIGTTIVNDITDSKTVNANTSSYKPGSYTLTIKFIDNITGYTTNATANLKITTTDSNMTIKILNSTINNVTLEVSVSDTKGIVNRSLINGNITVQDNKANIVATGKLTNGKTTIKLNISDYTQKNVIFTVKYLGDSVLKQCENKTKSVKYTLRDSKISIINTSDVYSNTSVTVRISDSETGAKITNGTVIVTSNGATIASASLNNDGTCTVKMNLDSKKYTLNITYNGSDYHKSSSITSNLTVKKLNTKLTVTVSNTAPTLTDTITITATLSDQFNRKLANQNIIITIENKTYNIKTNSNGQITQTHKITTVGSITVTAKYNGNTNYNNATTTTKITSKKINTKVTSTVVNKKVGNTSINVTLKTADNKAISNAKITVLDKNNKIIANATTNNNGISNIKLDLSGGTNSLTVKYDGNATYNPSNTTVSINVEKLTPKITLTATTPVVVNQTITITASVKDANNKPTTGNVTIRLNNNILKTITLSNGQATTTTKITNSGSNQIIATYNGNVNFTTITTNKTVTVNKLNTTLNISANNTAPRVNDKIKITVSLKDSSNKAVSNQNVTVKINEKSYALTTDKNGNAIVDYTLTKSDKAVNVTATFKSNGNYLASKNSLNITRKYQADMELLTGSFDTKPGDTVKLIAHIQDNHMDIDGGQLVFKLNGMSLKDENGSAVIVRIKNGLAILEYKIPDTLGARTHNLTAVYASNTYGRVELTTPMTIGKYVTHIDVNPLYTTNNKIRIKAQIVDQNNQALNKQTTVSIKLNGKSYTLNTTNGTIDYQINQTLANSYYNITIISGENGKYLGSTAKTVLIKSATEIKTNYINNTLNTKTTTKSGDIKTGNVMSILTGASTVKPGDRLKLIAHLSDEQIDISGGQLVFKLNGLSLKDENGSAVIVKIKDGLGILDYKIPDTLGARTHNLTAVYSSSKYDRVELSTDLTMNRLNTHIEIDPIFTSSSTNYIKAQILDDNNQLINKQTQIVIKIDGKSYNLTTSNGKINYKVPTTLSKGLHQITIIAGENGKYISSRKNTVLIQT